MPIITDRRRISVQLGWFGALWASGVLGMGLAAGLLRFVLFSRLFDPAPSLREPAAAKMWSQ